MAKKKIKDIFLKISTKYDPKGLDRAKKAIKGLAKIGAAAAVAVTGAFVKMIKVTKDTALEIDKLRKITGATSEELTRLKFAADQEHASMEAVATGIKRLARAMTDASTGLETYKRAFRDVDVQIQNADGTMRGTVDVMLDVADKFSTMTDETKKASLAQELFGRAGIELVPLLNLGRKEIEKLGDEAEKLGIVMTDETVIGFKAFDDSLTSLKAAVKGISITIATKFLPEIKNIVDGIKDAIVEGDTWQQAIQQLVTVSISGFKMMGAVITGLGETMGSVGFLLVTMFTKPKERIVSLQEAMRMFSDSTDESWNKMFGSLSEGWKNLTDGITGNIKEIKATADENQPVIPDNDTTDQSFKNMTKIRQGWIATVNVMKREGIKWQATFTTMFASVEGVFKDTFKEMIKGSKNMGDVWEAMMKKMGDVFLDLIATIVAKKAVLLLLKLLSPGAALAGAAGKAVVGAVSAAEGGVFSEPTLAMVGDRPDGEPEIVGTAGQMAGMGTKIIIQGDVNGDNAQSIINQIKEAVSEGHADGLAKQIVETGEELSDEAV